MKVNYRSCLLPTALLASPLLALITPSPNVCKPGNDCLTCYRRDAQAFPSALDVNECMSAQSKIYSRLRSFEAFTLVDNPSPGPREVTSPLTDSSGSCQARLTLIPPATQADLISDIVNFAGSAVLIDCIERNPQFDGGEFKFPDEGAKLVFEHVPAATQDTAVDRLEVA